jgi:hypothetical protein
MEMYDMQADPRQLTILASDPRHKKTLTGLLDKLNTKLNAMK